MSIPENDLIGIVDFLRRAGDLKETLRSTWTVSGRQESTAEHSWRLGLFCMLIAPHFPELDGERLLKLSIVHDLGEAINGDIPAPDQIDTPDKSGQEEADLKDLLRPLLPQVRQEILSLWEEYEFARTPEARVVKALDKLETMLQQTQGKNPETFDFGFNLSYGTKYTANGDIIRFIRELIDAETESCHLCQKHHKRAR